MRPTSQNKGRRAHLFLIIIACVVVVATQKSKLGERVNVAFDKNDKSDRHTSKCIRVNPSPNKKPLDQFSDQGVSGEDIADCYNTKKKRCPWTIQSYSTKVTVN